MVGAAANWRDFIAPEVGSVTIGEWVEVDLRHLRDAGSVSVNDIAESWRQYLQAINPAASMRSLCRREAMAYFRWLRHQSESKGSPAPATIHKHHSLLRASVRRAMALGYIEANPFAEWPRGVLPERRPLIERSELSLAPHDVSRLLSLRTIPAVRRTFYAFAFGTGARIGELFEMRFSDLRIMPGRTGLTVCRAYSQKRKEVGATKTRSSAVIPLHPVLEEMAGELWARTWRDECGRTPQQGDLLFPRLWLNEVRHQYQGTALELWKQDLAAIELAPRPFHCTRHTFMSLARGAGCDVDMIDSLIHPKSRNNTRTGYGIWPWETLCAEVEKLPISREREAEQLILV